MSGNLPKDLVSSLESTAEALRGPDMEQVRGLMMDAAGALRAANETCEWPEIDDGLFYIACTPREEWHLPPGQELYPHCPYCGRKVMRT